MKLMTVRVIGAQGISEFDVTEHEILGFPAGTYHKLSFPDGKILYLNDFGIRSVGIVEKEKEKKDPDKTD